MDFSNIHPPNSVDSTSVSLIERLRANDDEAWRDLLTIYGPVVLFWIQRGGLPAQDSGDVFQDVFVTVTQSIGQFQNRNGKATFRAWLKQITLSRLTDHFRRRSTVTRSETRLAVPDYPEIPDDDSSAPDLSATDQHAEDMAIVRGMLDLLKQEFHELTWRSFWLTAVDQLSAVEAASQLGMSPEAVRKNKSRVIARLRTLLAEYFGQQ